MPFRKRSFRKRSFRRFKRKGLRRRVKRLSRSVRGIIGAGIQRFSTSDHASASSGIITSTHNSTGSSSSNGVVLLTGMGQGTTQSTRTGMRVQFYRLIMRGMTYNSVAQSAGSRVNNIGRIIVLMIKDNASSSLATGANDITTLMSDWQGGGGMANVLTTFKSEMIPKRAVVLVDKFINQFNVNAESSATGIGLGRIMPWKFSINLRKKTRGYSSYSQTAAGSTSCENNHVFAYFIESNTVPGTAGSLTSLWTYKLSFLP